jgi:hypothetical protein
MWHCEGSICCRCNLSCHKTRPNVHAPSCSKIAKAAQAHHQTHDFNDDGLWVRQLHFFAIFHSSLNIFGHIDVD